MGKSKSRGKRKRKSRPQAPVSRYDKLARAGRQVEIRTFEISDDVKDAYKPGIADEIAEATILLKRRQVDEAKTAFQSILKREPRAREAYANLAAACMLSGEEERAEALSREAMDKFPKYVLPRTNLAQFCLRRGQVDEAEQLLLPLDGLRKFTSSEFQYYALIWSDMWAARRDYNAALSWLKLLSEAMPGTPGLRGRCFRYRIRRLFHRESPGEQGE